MMEATLPRSWVEEFERAATARREDAVYREKTIRFETRQREHREERTEEQRDRETSAALDMALASTEEIVTFKVDLDRDDALTVEALMDNQEAFERETARINALLEEATVLPDGRRVFKSRDGQRVVDEHGKDLAREIVDPTSIDDRKPDWETFKASMDERIRLTEERQALTDYQTKLDDARERLDSGDITNKELKELKAELGAEMPDAVRAKLERDEPQAAEARPPQRNVVLPEATDALMRQTGFAPPMPGLSR